jgi:2',3'-cyclic-nucleotide 2'-phosphodiesterase (5'-nucleotidase family)
MLSSEIYRNQTMMWNVFTLTRLLRSSLLLLSLCTFSTTLFAQSAAIEPCQATTSPKPSATNSTVAPTKVSEKASQTLIDSGIADDAAIEKMLAPYAEKVRPLSMVIGTLEGDLKKGSVGAGSLGNFVTDAILAEAKKRAGKNLTIALLNAGGLRKNEIAAGQLRAMDIFELLPFENELIVLDLSGAQLLKIVQGGARDAQAGARIQFRWNDQNRTEFISAKLLDSQGHEIEIDPNKTYTVVTIDYLYNLKSGAYSLLQEAKNVKPLNVTLRDAVIDYVKSESAAGRSIKARLDDRFVQIGPGPAKKEDPPDD